MKKKHVIWDLNGTLFRPDNLVTHYEQDDLSLVIDMWAGAKDPSSLYLKALEILSNVPVKQPLAHNPALLSTGQPVPEVIAQWSAGHLSCSQAMALAIDYYKATYSTMLDKTTANTLERFIRTCFDPYAVAHIMQAIKPCISLLAQCVLVRHTQLSVLSNWDTESFELLLTLNQGQQVFKYFTREHLFISGELHMLKPDPRIYAYILEALAASPQDCLVIDDQLENVLAARSCGMHAFHFKEHDLDRLTQSLYNLNMLV